MTRTSSLLLLASLLVTPACVLSPTWGDEPTRRDPIDFSGMASRASAPIRIQAWNHGTATFDTVAAFTGGTTRYASDPDLYGWSKVGVRLADRYWVPTGAPCQTGGMANLRVQEINTDGTTRDLATFDAAGQACLDEHLADGDHPVAAGNACKRDNATIVLFAPAQCVAARTADATPPSVSVRLATSATAHQRTSGEPDRHVTFGRTLRLTATGFVRDLDGAVARVRIDGHYDVACRSSAGTISTVRYPIASVMSQPVTAGALTAIGLEVNKPIDVPAYVTSCPAGYAFYRLAGEVVATGTNAAGGSVTSPRLTFAL